MKDQDWLVARIWDIMHKKNISVNRLCPLAGFKYPMELQRYLDGSKPITPSILSSIAEGLGITIQRLEMEDYLNDTKLLRSSLGSGRLKEQSLEFAKLLVSVSVGTKENIEALRDLGWTYYHLGELENAKECWEKAVKLAEKKDKRGKGRVVAPDLLFSAMMDITVYYTDTGEYQTALDIMENSQPLFLGDIEKIGMIHQQRGLCISKLGDKESAKANYLIAKDCFSKLKSPKRLGRVQINLASLDYHAGNIQTSLDLLYQAKENLRDSTLFIQLTILKDIAKSLIMLGNTEEAIFVIDEGLELFEGNVTTNSEVECMCKLFLMRCDITGDSTYGERALQYLNLSRELLCALSDTLTTIFMKDGDNQKALKYYNLVKQHTINGVEDYKTGEWF